MEYLSEPERYEDSAIPRDFIPTRDAITAPEWDALYDAALSRMNVPDPEVAAAAFRDLYILKGYLGARTDD